MAETLAVEHEKLVALERLRDAWEPVVRAAITWATGQHTGYDLAVRWEPLADAVRAIPPEYRPEVKP
jgi:hypothetical protein